MQESGPTSPSGADSPRQAVASEKPASQPKPAKAKPAGTGSSPQRTSDPVVRWLTFVILGVIILWLVGMLSAMMFGLLTPAKAPRTSTEAQLLTLSGQVDSGKATPQVYSQYVSVLIDAGQFSRAQESLNTALKSAKTDKSYLYAQQARLALAQKDYQGAVQAADKAMAEAQKELKAFMDENVRNNRRADAGAKVPQSYGIAALSKAEALLGSKDYANAVKAFDIYLKGSPTDSDVLVRRGTTKVQIGDKAGAEKDFREALKFIPDYQPALDGLKQIGAAQ
jgi:tetratricopeptide (TPR) repeat protein